LKPVCQVKSRAELLKYLEERGINEQTSVSNITDHWLQTYIAERVAHRSTGASVEQSTNADVQATASQERPAITRNESAEPTPSQFPSESGPNDRGSRAERAEPQPEPVTPEQNQQQVERTIAHQQPQLDGAKVVAETEKNLVVEKPDGAQTLVKKDSAHLKEEEQPALTTSELAQVQRKFDTLKSESSKSGQPIDSAIDDFLNQTTMFGEQFTDAQAKALREMAKKEPKTSTPAPSMGSLFDVAPTQESKLQTEIEKRKKEDEKRKADAPPPLFANENPLPAQPVNETKPTEPALPANEAVTPETAPLVKPESEERRRP
jgi:hypothetical protein